MTVTGAWLGSLALVQAVDRAGRRILGDGTLARDDGTTVLVNRGFVPADHATPPPGGLSPGPITVTGLLRMPEPGGAFLRANDPAADRWFSRDVAAIAASRGLTGWRPISSTPNGPAGSGLPIGGLTVMTFSNNHLVYALTWAASR